MSVKAHYSFLRTCHCQLKNNLVELSGLGLDNKANATLGKHNINNDRQKRAKNTDNRDASKFEDFADTGGIFPYPTIICLSHWMRHNGQLFVSV